MKLLMQFTLQWDIPFKMWIKILFLIFILFPNTSWAAGARMRNIEVEMTHHEIRSSFVLVNGLSKKLERDINDGIQKELYYYIVLVQKHENWFDEEIAATTIQYTLKYDTLKKIYTVRRKEGSDQTEHTFDQMASMWAFISKGEHIFVAPQSILKPNHRYFLLLKAQMKVSRVPLHLDRFLFFIPFLELDTPWGQSRSIEASHGNEN